MPTSPSKKILLNITVCFLSEEMTARYSRGYWWLAIGKHSLKIPWNPQRKVRGTLPQLYMEMGLKVIWTLIRTVATWKLVNSDRCHTGLCGRLERSSQSSRAHPYDLGSLVLPIQMASFARGQHPEHADLKVQGDSLLFLIAFLKNNQKLHVRACVCLHVGVCW